ncbi:MAG: aminodeoxychorismate/anthranilate synthase component II [Pseudomonadota bacterium]|nr:aminodeoxychorismate/anthranilate synthase component II [Pseudomonadota bacterium]
MQTDKIVIVDHYDSFTYNLKHWLQWHNQDKSVEIIAFDDCEAIGALLHNPCPLVLSAGPHTPQEAAPTQELFCALRAQVPILGICLGMQIICAALGVSIRKSKSPLHGRRRMVQRLCATGILADMPDTFAVAAYNSLAASADDVSLPAGWSVSAVSAEREIQVLEYLGNPPICGVQFHPESFLA